MNFDPGLLSLLAILLLIGAAGLFASTLSRAEPPSAPQEPPARPSDPLRVQLSRAGLRGDLDGSWYFATKVGLALLLALGVLTFTDPFMIPGSGRTILALAAAAFGFVVPSVLLRLSAERRHRSLRAGLPDLLDLIVTCLEAGNGLEEAVRRATRELARHGSPLADELQTTLDDWAGGRSRIAAVEELRRRTNVEDLAEFMGAIEEARREGTTITETLRSQAAALRSADAARKEEWARKVPILVAVNLAIFVLPAAFVAVLGSSVVQAVRLLLPAF